MFVWYNHVIFCFFLYKYTCETFRKACYCLNLQFNIFRTKKDDYKLWKANKGKNSGIYERFNPILGGGEGKEMYIIRSLNLMMTKKHVKVGKKKSQTIPRAPGFQKRVFSDVFFWEVIQPKPFVVWIWNFTGARQSEYGYAELGSKRINDYFS